MRLCRTVPILTTLSLAVAACQAGIAPLSDEDVASIRAVHDSWHEHIVAGNWSAVVELYTEDVVVMPPNEAAIQGRANLLAWMEAYPEILEANLSIQEIDGYGDIAYVRGTYAMTVSIGGMEVRDTGKYVEIRRKQGDGSWPLAVDIFNSDLPAPGN
jgi:ketosteroid isomerase-like protein